MCFSRVKENQQPACVEACPNQALSFGMRDELLNLAHRRIEAENTLYIPHIWGETEFGGTSVLYISDVDLSALDWPEPSFQAIPNLTESLIESTPFIGLGVASSLLGVNWVIRRRMQLERERRIIGRIEVKPKAENENDE
jgi:hypothetical protein